MRSIRARPSPATPAFVRASLVALLLGAFPAATVFARPSPPRYEAPRHPQYGACLEQADQNNVRGVFQRLRYINQCIDERAKASQHREPE